MTRFLPPRFEAYIAWSALIISCVARLAVVGEADDADRDRRRDLAAADRDRQLGHADPDLLGEDPGAGRIRLGQEHDELVAAVAGGRVDLADARADHLADAAQHLVAEVVAVACR